MAQTSLVGIVCTVILLLIAAQRFLAPKDNGKEPPAVTSAIPIVGHIVGMIRHKVFYYEMLRQRTKSPIFSVPILGSNIYVVASPRLVTMVQRLHKALAFEPIVAKATQSVAGCSSEAQSIMQTNLDGSQGPRSYVRTFRDIMKILMPGPALDSMNGIMIRNIANSADKLAAGTGASINLFKWLRHELTMATTNSVYGPGNPYVDPVIEDAFWDFEENLMLLLVNVLPSVTARAGTKARNKVAKAFYSYFSNNEHLKGSALVQARYNHSRDYGVSVEDIATFEVGGSLAVLTNTFPTAYWMLIYIYSHPDVLQECRDEVLKVSKSTDDESGYTTHSIDMTSIKASCPVITATLQEVLRHTAVGSTVREVTEDTMLDGYLLKKGRTLLTPANVLHTDTGLWGENTDNFDHRRFLKAPGKKLPNPVAFRAFGGGTTLCPGRHFATTEVLAIATMFIARFDMQPIGEWPEPDRKNAQLWTQILGTSGDFEVEVREREEFRGRHKWTFDLTESEMLFAMAAEDLAEEKSS